MVLGYAYPAYNCYKTLERTTPRVEILRFWCQYRILLAFLTAFESFADSAVSWLPMYGVAKVALVVYLWHPKTMGARHVYDDYPRPFLARHEADIDRGLLEMRTRARNATTTTPSRRRGPSRPAATFRRRRSRSREARRGKYGAGDPGQIYCFYQI